MSIQRPIDTSCTVEPRSRLATAWMARRQLPDVPAGDVLPQRRRRGRQGPQDLRQVARSPTHASSTRSSTASNTACGAAAANVSAGASSSAAATSPSARRPTSLTVASRLVSSAPAVDGGGGGGVGGSVRAPRPGGMPRSALRQSSAGLAVGLSDAVFELLLRLAEVLGELRQLRTAEEHAER